MAILRCALESGPGATLAAAIPAGAITLIAVDDADLDLAALVLPIVSAALDRAGVQRSRQRVLVADSSTPNPGAEARHAVRLESALRLLARADLPLVCHDRTRSLCFVAGRTAAGLPIELDDELREAEALVTLGTLASGGEADLTASSRVIFPGLTSRLCAERVSSRDARGVVPIDLEVCWLDHPTAPRVWVGRGGEAECAMSDWARTHRSRTS